MLKIIGGSGKSVMAYFTLSQHKGFLNVANLLLMTQSNLLLLWENLAYWKALLR